MEGLKTVNVYEEIKYVWQCECGQFNDEDEDPGYSESVVCEGCGSIYKPVSC